MKIENCKKCNSRKIQKLLICNFCYKTEKFNKNSKENCKICKNKFGFLLKCLDCLFIVSKKFKKSINIENQKFEKDLNYLEIELNKTYENYRDFDKEYFTENQNQFYNKVLKKWIEKTTKYKSKLSFKNQTKLDFIIENKEDFISILDLFDYKTVFYEYIFHKYFKKIWEKM